LYFWISKSNLEKVN